MHCGGRGGSQAGCHCRAGVAGYAILHDGLYSTAVISATAIALAREGAFERAVEYVKKAAEAAYKAAREIFEKA
ncbi:hypothetical protein CGL51_14700, partial [Pyrobaculum aerophilum]